jgi:glutamyl-tRNA synthetase
MVRSRIAPTPSGYLHAGNALNFIITWLYVRSKSGSLRLRIDDLDAPRARAEYIDDIFKTLEWLGVDWDEGPQSADEQSKKYSQTLRLDRYHELIKLLIQQGGVFACSCSRKEILEHNTDALYPGTCRYKKLATDSPDTALRIITDEGMVINVPHMQARSLPVELYKVMRDFVIRRRDGIPAYHVASLADDTDFGINMIIRGADLVTSSAAQLFLAQKAALDVFSKASFYHHPLISDSHGNKLSKSAGSMSLMAWRERHQTPDDFYLWVCKTLGWQHQALSLTEMLELVKKQSETLYIKSEYGPKSVNPFGPL